MSDQQLQDEISAWRQRAQQAEQDLERVRKAATGTAWKLRHQVAKLEKRVRELEGRERGESHP